MSLMGRCRVHEATGHDVHSTQTNAAMAASKSASLDWIGQASIAYCTHDWATCWTNSNAVDHALSTAAAVEAAQGRMYSDTCPGDTSFLTGIAISTRAVAPAAPDVCCTVAVHRCSAQLSKEEQQKSSAEETTRPLKRRHQILHSRSCYGCGGTANMALLTVFRLCRRGEHTLERHEELAKPV